MKSELQRRIETAIDDCLITMTSLNESEVCKANARLNLAALIRAWKEFLI